jgi:peptidoglycan hydrolase-like protein with peptidoglycan-binding domain
MAELNFAKFAASARIRRAADNAPPMKPGEPDRDAVKILQEALIQAGFKIKDGPTGFYGPQTVAAVKQVESKHGLNTDAGIAGHQVITQLDALLTGRKPIFIVRAANLQLLLQQTDTLGGFTHRSYFTKAVTLLDEFGLGLSITNRRLPEFEFPGLLVDPANASDVASVRALAEKQIVGMSDVLRIIFCRFPGLGQSGEKFFGTTEGGRRPLEGGLTFPDFILINVEKRRMDDSTLIHEMIHATGLDVHDPDPQSVFASGATRTGSVLKPEHAERLSKGFFARVRH